MGPWKDHLLQVMQTILQNPATSTERWILLTTALLVALAVFNKVADAFGVVNLSGGSVFNCVGLGFALILGAIVAGRIYLPDIFMTRLALFPMIASALVVSAVLAVPLMKRIVQGGYLVLLFTWLVSLGATIGIILLCSSGFDIYRGMMKNMNKGKSHNDDIFQFLKR